MSHVLTRREAIRFGLAGLGLVPTLAAWAADHPARKRSCIVLWMSGGPSQTDTFDPKPGHRNGGPFMAIDTVVEGVRIGEHLPEVAKQMKHLAVVRSMATREGDHGRATLHLRTGNLPQRAIQFPVFGSLVAKEKEVSDSDLPGFVSISPRFGTASLSAGFLGPKYASLVVGGNGDVFDTTYGNDTDGLRVEHLGLPRSITPDRAAQRRELLEDLETDFLTSRPGIATESHRSAYQRAARLHVCD